MAVYEKKTKVNMPDWVIALVAVALILVATVFLVKYFSVIILWLR